MSDQQRIRISLSISALLAIIVFVLIYVASKNIIEQGINNIIIMIAGMLSVSTISMLSTIFGSQSSASSQSVYFDEDRTRQAVNEIIDVGFSEVRTKSSEINQRWEPSDDVLLGQDPALALAKLRIDIERELRRIAFQENVGIEIGKISISRLMDKLTKQKTIGFDVVSIIESILPVCNAAIHGGDVKIDVAMNVLDIGRDLLALLRSYPRDKDTTKVGELAGGSSKADEY